MIKLSNVYKTYRMKEIEVNVLKDLTLHIEAGDFVAINGPSGSGKSTLLNIIGCIDSSDSGSVIIDSKDCRSLSDGELSKMRRQNIGYVFQSFNLIPVLTAFENVDYPLFLNQVPTKERKEKVRELLSQVGLEAFHDHLPDRLSGGQRQRVAIARALAVEPKIVIADEPTANLDSHTTSEIMDLLSGFNENLRTTFVFATHDTRVNEYAKKSLHITDGRLQK